MSGHVDSCLCWTKDEYKYVVVGGDVQVNFPCINLEGEFLPVYFKIDAEPTGTEQSRTTMTVVKQQGRGEKREK